MNRRNVYCVIYRTGGRLNYRWRRTIAFSKQEAKTKLAEVVRAGYTARIENFWMSLAIGLPETFE